MKKKTKQIIHSILAVFGLRNPSEIGKLVVMANWMADYLDRGAPQNELMDARQVAEQIRQFTGPYLDSFEGLESHEVHQEVLDHLCGLHPNEADANLEQRQLLIERSLQASDDRWNAVRPISDRMSGVSAAENHDWSLPDVDMYPFCPEVQEVTKKPVPPSPVSPVNGKVGDTVTVNGTIKDIKRGVTKDGGREWVLTIIELQSSIANKVGTLVKCWSCPDKLVTLTNPTAGGLSDKFLIGATVSFNATVKEALHDDEWTGRDGKVRKGAKTVVVNRPRKY